MSLLKKYSEYLNAGEAEKLTALFTEDALFHDEAPTKLGQDPLILNGRNEIASFFDAILAGGGLGITNVGINGNAMRYDVSLGDTSLLALGVVTEEHGLIKEYRVIGV